jgi:hypothetical protein
MVLIGSLTETKETYTLYVSVLVFEGETIVNINRTPVKTKTKNKKTDILRPGWLL